MATGICVLVNERVEPGKGKNKHVKEEKKKRKSCTSHVWRPLRPTSEPTPKREVDTRSRPESCLLLSLYQQRREREEETPKKREGEKKKKGREILSSAIEEEEEESVSGGIHEE